MISKIKRPVRLEYSVLPFPKHAPVSFRMYHKHILA